MALQKGAYSLALAGQAVVSNGGLGQVLNPEGVDLIIDRLVLVVETPSAGGADINVGVGTAGADNSNLIAGLAIDGVITGKAYGGTNPAAKAEHVKWGAAQVLNATGSAACGAFVGTLYVTWIRA